jgi:hypothetical protein
VPVLDGSLELLWLREGRTLDVVDLRAPKPTRIHIARALPESAAFGITRRVEGSLVNIGRPPACPTDVVISLEWFGEPTLNIDREGEPATREDRKARLVGKGWLDANRDRAGGVHPPFLDPWRNGERFVAEIPASMKKCHPGLDCPTSGYLKRRSLKVDRVDILVDHHSYGVHAVEWRTSSTIDHDGTARYAAVSSRPWALGSRVPWVFVSAVVTPRLRSIDDRWALLRD